MSDSEQPYDSDEPSLPDGFRMRPSGNHKKRSRLRQAADEPAPEPAAPEPVEPSQSAPAELPPIVRKFRLKRSGQMHDDLTSPEPGEKAPPRREDVY